VLFFFLSDRRGEEEYTQVTYRCTVVNCDIIEASNSLDCINKMMDTSIF